MKRIVLALLFLSWTASYSQENEFLPDSTAGAKFKITSDTISMKDFKIVLTTFKPLSPSVAQYIGTKVWVKRIIDGKVTEKYLGEITSDTGVYRPNPQPIEDVFIIVECRERSGQLNLISKDGDFVTFPGYYFSLDEPGLIYTKYPDSDNLTYKYDLISQHKTDLRDKGIKKENLVFENVDRAFWVK